jgi:hypothetical protein
MFPCAWGFRNCVETRLPAWLGLAYGCRFSIQFEMENMKLGLDQERAPAENGKTQVERSTKTARVQANGSRKSRMYAEIVPD